MAKHTRPINFKGSDPVSVTKHEQNRRALEEDVAAFLAKGGMIQELAGPAKSVLSMKAVGRD